MVEEMIELLVGNVLSAFRVDAFPPMAAAQYRVDGRICWFLDVDSKVRKGEGIPRREIRLPLSKHDPSLLALRAAEMLLLAAATNPPVAEEDLPCWFEDHDLPYHVVWQIGATTLALTEPEFLGMYAIKEDQPEDIYKVLGEGTVTSNILLHNPLGVVRVAAGRRS